MHQNQKQKPIEQVIDLAIEAMAEEQVRFLRKSYRMTAADIINLYTGAYKKTARYEDAVRTVMEHRSTASLVKAANLASLHTP
jgi:hypothetical protein